MSSVPTAKSGLASAINNAVSRIGPQLVGAVVFVAVTASFYSGLQARLPHLDTSSPSLREDVAPLNRPAQRVDEDTRQAAHEASTTSFHLAMGLAAGFMLAGALINALGIRDTQTGSGDAAHVTGVLAEGQASQ
jgi:hypothetical protein